MPLQNRVTPRSQIEATPHRGLVMGNRGRLHNDQKQLVKQTWTTRAWIICNLVHRDWHRPVMAPGRYTELFFLDEAVALAAGHRPCAMCRNQAFKHYQSLTGNLPAPQIDAILHQQRLALHWQNELPPETIANLPDGAFVLLPQNPTPYLLHQKKLHAFDHSGYQAPQPVDPNTKVQSLTPTLTLQALQNGYTPQIHPTAGVQ